MVKVSPTHIYGLNRSAYAVRIRACLSVDVALYNALRQYDEAVARLPFGATFRPAAATQYTYSE